MTDSSGAHAERNRVLWSHFQQHDRGVFENAIPRLDRVAREVLRRTETGGVVLTIGVGDGYLERKLRAAGRSVRALDPDPETIGALEREGFDARVGQIEALPLADGECSCAVASEVLEHLTQEQSDAGMREVARVLAPGAYFVATVPFAERLADQTVRCPHCFEEFHRWGHCRSFDEDAMRADLGRFFEVVHLDHRAFVSFRGRSVRRVVSGSARWVLGRLGSQLAYPNIFFVGRRLGTERSAP